MTDAGPLQFVDGLPHLAVRRRQLACGLDVVIHHDPTAPQVVVHTMYRVGSSDEQPTRTGLAHLFEHVFKGPAVRRHGHHYEVLRRAGALEANASTGPDRTNYYEVVPAHQLALALWVESDRMGYFADGPDGITTHRLEAQQAVVRAERRQRYEDVAYGLERFAIGAALYPEGHPLRHLTIGRHEDIQAATLADVIAFYRTWYVPANATLVIAGDVPDDVDALVDRYFGGFPASQRPLRATPVAPPPPRHAIELADPFAALARVHRAWPAPAHAAPDDAELDVATTAWCAVGTGALWQRLVYETQLAQRVSAWVTSNRLAGELHVAVDLRTGADPAAVRAILDECCAAPVEPRAIERVVTRREANAVWGLTGLVRRANTLQRNLLYGEHPDGLAAELARYRAVTPERVAAALARTCDPAVGVDVQTDPAAPATPRASASSAA